MNVPPSNHDQRIFFIITTSGDTKKTLSLKMICSEKKYKIKVFTDAGKE